MTAVLSEPGGALAIRVRLLDSSEWRPLGQVDGDSAAIGDRVIFDWGREVVGYLNVTFEETAGAKALLWAGLEPTGSAGPVSTYLLKPNGRRSWTDSEPTRFRYLIVHSTRPITGARVFELDERARDLVPDVTPALGVFGLQPALSTPSVENEIRRDLEGVTGVADG